MDVEKIFRLVRIGVGVVLLGALVFKVLTIPKLDTTLLKVNNTIDKVGTAVDKSNALLDSAHKFGSEVSHDYFDPAHPNDGLYYNIQDDLYNSSKASQELSASIIDTTANINGGVNSSGKNVVGILPQVQTLVSTLDSSVRGLSDSFNTITNDADGALAPLKQSLSDMDGLVLVLKQEVASGGNVDKTIASLNQTVVDTDKLIADPSIVAILANSAGITEHLDSSAETLDIVLMPYRKKISQIKWAINKLIDMIKLTVPIF